MNPLNLQQLSMLSFMRMPPDGVQPPRNRVRGCGLPGDRGLRWRAPVGGWGERRVGRGVTALPGASPAPNKALQPTADSRRSSVAPAASSG